jgi:hypothetical protein
VLNIAAGFSPLVASDFEGVDKVVNFDRNDESNPMTEGGLIGLAQLLKALKRYLEESGESERSAAARIAVNRHSLRRWLSGEESPKGGKLALAAIFLRRAGYL